MPTVREVLGCNPDWTFVWSKLMDEGFTRPDDATPGLYVVWAAEGRPLYVGRSLDLRRRLGQFLGAVFGGWGLHSGGYRIHEWRASGKLSLLLADLRFEIWKGLDAYEAEPRVIHGCDPRINVAEAARSLPALVIDDAVLQTIFSPATSEDARLTSLGALLEVLVRGVDRVPFPAEMVPWVTGSWKGVGRRVGKRWRNTVYAGFTIRDGAVRVGLWAYENDDLWLGHKTGANETSDSGTLLSVADSWRRSWYDM